MRYLIKSDKPFDGIVETIVHADGTVGYTDGLTVNEYRRERDYNVRVIDAEELDRLVADFEDGLKTLPFAVSAERYDEALNVLPPCRWHSVGGWSVFHISEHLRGDLVSWLAKRGDEYREFTQSCYMTDLELSRLLNATKEPPRETRRTAWTYPF